uniref:Uncharacterized protein n=1 Tax=Ditylenchus dipsaci TaxID=166011 RepID=A0A915CYP0_9BILA
MLVVVTVVVLLAGCSAQIYPITPQPAINMVSSSSRPVEMELVDQIESIDVTSNQVVISTSRMGPPESMKVSIGVVDIETGRYTINFLTPNRWYGIRFRCEQQYGGPAGTIYVNQEDHLVKTHKKDGSIWTHSPWSQFPLNAMEMEADL